MANPDELKILIEGVAVWNKWIEESFRVNPDLSGANLSGYKLNYINLSSANLTGANFNKAELLGAKFDRAILDRANLYGALLQMASFVWARLDDTKFGNAVMGGTVFGFNDFSQTIGLDSVRHNGPSAISIDSLYKSRGNIPEVFLRGCGVPDEFIIYARSLVEAGKAIQFYSCFISHSSNDQEFAERLYAGLQNKGVRCWFAPEDLKIGDKIRDCIDESIRLRDKLLLILSEHSIASDWVEHEVESALEEERQRGRTILFPIRLDDAVMESNKAWAALIRRTRHIGDFTRWKDHDSYQKAFDRLLRDLKASK
jgi:hypothetical protein